MEMPMLIIDQQPAVVPVNPAVGGKTANARRTERAGTFQSTLNKVLEGTSPEGVPNTGRPFEEEKAVVEPLAALIQSGGEAVFYVLPVMAETTEVVVTAKGGTDSLADSGPQVMPDIFPVLDRASGEGRQEKNSATHAPAEQVSQNVDVMRLADITGGQKSQPEGAPGSEQDGNFPVITADQIACGFLAEEGQHSPGPKASKANMPVDAANMAVKPAATMHPAVDPPSPAQKFAGQEREQDLSTRMAMTPSAPADPEMAIPPKAEQPIDMEAAIPAKAGQPADLLKETDTGTDVLTAVARPTSAARVQNGANGFHPDTSENPATMTPMAAAQVFKAETVNIPFPAVEVPPPVKEQVFQEIVQRARFMSNGAQQEMQIQLKPEHLGLLNVQITVENGTLTAKFQTENPQVKQALEASFAQLKQDLQAQGFKVQHVTVSIAQQGMSFSEFSRRSPQFNMVKSKRIDKVDLDPAEQQPDRTSLVENYGGLPSGGVDYKI